MFPEPAYHGGLPTDPDELLRYLREHPVDLHLPEAADEEAVYGDESMAYATARSMLHGYVPPERWRRCSNCWRGNPGRSSSRAMWWTRPAGTGGDPDARRDRR
ncbi:hypothetical protein NKG94_24455 [Micromonospora sp. M12]